MEQKALIRQNQPSKRISVPKILVDDGTIGPDGRYYSTYAEFIVDAMAATGTQDGELAYMLINQCVRAQGPVSQNTEFEANNALAMLTEFKCRDISETILSIQIIALHSHSTKLFNKAYSAPHSDLQKDYYNMALKLSRSMTGMLEMLEKYRRKGTYKMKIEHLHVHDGGQAIVGTINHQDTGGRDSNE